MQAVQKKKRELIFKKVKIGLISDYALFRVVVRQSSSKSYYQLKFLAKEGKVKNKMRSDEEGINEREGMNTAR